MPMPAIVTPPISPATYVDPIEDYDPYYLDNLNEDPFEGVEIDGIPFGELMDGDNFPSPPPLVRSTNLIEEFDAEWDEDYLPEPPVLAREHATSHVWSVLPDPLEIIPNHTINNPNPANVIIYNEPSLEENITTTFPLPEIPTPLSEADEAGLCYFADLRGNTYAVDLADCLYLVRQTDEGPDYELVGTWNTDEGVPEFYPDYRP